MLPTKTRDANHTFEPPRDWEKTCPGETCSALEARIELHGERVAIVSTWKPTPDELRLLNEGGVIEQSIMSVRLPPSRLTVVPGPLPATIAIREDNHYTHDRGMSYDEHGPATP